MSFLIQNRSFVRPPTCVGVQILFHSFFLSLSSPVQISHFHTVFFVLFLSVSLFIGILKKQQQQVQVTLKQFARDWSTDGEEERQQCYAPIINEIEKFYTADKVYV